MGIFYGHKSKAALVLYLTEGDRHRYIPRHCTRGNILWTIEQTEEKTYIGCYKLTSDRGDWGYKSMCEADYPFYFTCPTSYLKLVPVANQEWRNEVLKYQESRRSISAMKSQRQSLGETL